MDQHSRRIPEKFPKNHTGLLSSFLRRSKAEDYDLTPLAKNQSLKPYCSHWLKFKVQRNSWGKQTRHNCHGIKGDHVKVSGHLLGPLPKHRDGTTPAPLHSQLGALSALFTDTSLSPRSHFHRDLSF